MSANYALRSDGRPYFAVVQDDLAFMDPNTPTCPQENPAFFLRVAFRIDALPVQLASADEIHPLIAYTEHTLGRDLAVIGVTPSGRLVAKAMDGPAVQTAAGFIQAGPLWHDAFADFSETLPIDRLFYLSRENPIGDTDFQPSGTNLVASSTTPRDPIVPAAGNLGRFILFNGVKAEARIAGAISLAEFTAPGFAGARWSINERFGSTLRVNPDYALPDVPQNYNLTAQYFNPLFYAPAWGAFPDGDASDAYEWELHTAWAKRDLPETVWAKAAS